MKQQQLITCCFNSLISQRRAHTTTTTTIRPKQLSTLLSLDKFVNSLVNTQPEKGKKLKRVHPKRKRKGKHERVENQKDSSNKKRIR